MAAFVDKFIEYTKESETPTSFWKWGAYAIVAAVLRDNVFWHQRGHKHCPNIYVVLNADSATHRKSNPVVEASRILSDVRVTKVIRGRGSIQAILEALAASSMDKDTGKQIRGGSCILLADELKSFFVGDDALIGILTDIYDFKPKFDYNLRGSPFKVTDLCVNLLSASNDEFLKGIFTSEAVFGGLLRRTFLVRPDEYRKGNSLLETEEEEEQNITKYDPSPLIAMLVEMSKLKGKVKFEANAKIYYDNWYLPLRQSYEKKPDKTGVIAGIHTSVVKIAVILAVSRRLELVVRRVDIEDAINECMALLPNYDGFAMSQGKSTEANAGALLMTSMWENGGFITKTQFLSKYWYEVSAETLDKLIVTLTQAGYIQTSFSAGSTDTYVMTPQCKEIFEKKHVTESASDKATN